MADWFDDFEEAPQAPAAPREREMVPEGEHALEIKGTIDHGDRLEVRLAHADKRYGWVFCRIYKDADWAKKLAHELRLALGVPRGGLVDAVKDGSLVGREVVARIYHRANEKGTFANVGEFKAAEPAAAAPAPKSTRRPPAAKVLDKIPEDDIPF